MKKIIIIVISIIVIIIGWFFFFGHKQSLKPSLTHKMKIYTSFYPLYFFAAQIGGEKADVLNITPAGVEPHDYDPSAQDIARIEQGNMLLLNGGVEAWGDKMKENLKGTRVAVVVAGEGLITKQDLPAGRQDPHVWLNPQLAKKEVAKITAEYIAIDQGNASHYRKNENVLDNKLDKLDAQYKQALSSCNSRDIVTSHAAFAYLAQQYNLRQISIAGLSPDAEPSAQQLADVADFAKKNDMKYIFFESLVSPKLSQTIAQEVGAKTLVLDPLEGIPKEKIQQGSNYFTVMEQNLKNLQLALQCQK
jgi:zinc transport system substrate-binding protein